MVDMAYIIVRPRIVELSHMTGFCTIFKDVDCIGRTIGASPEGAMGERHSRRIGTVRIWIEATVRGGEDRKLLHPTHRGEA